MYKVKISFTTDDLAVLQSNMNLLESKDVDYAVKIIKQKPSNFLRKTPDGTINIAAAHANLTQENPKKYSRTVQKKY